jgi:hypothetical protein
MKVGPAGGGLITMRCTGQSVGTEAELRAQLPPLVALGAPSSPLMVKSLGFLDAVKHFAGPLDYESVFMKAKSDYVLDPLDAGAIQAMLAAVAAIPAGGVVLLCDSYDGKISDVAADATAFPRRDGTQYCIQYYSSWTRAADTPTHGRASHEGLCGDAALHAGRLLRELLRSRLPDYPNAYWGDNLTRLMAVKQQYDPQNLFHQSQSVPPPPQA